MTSPNRRDIILDIEVRSDTAGATAAARGLDDVADKADKADDKLREAGESADKASDRFKGMSDDARRLGIEVERTKAKIAELQSQMLEFGDDRVLRSQLRQQRAWLATLEQIGRDMPDDNPVARQIRRQFSQAAGEGIIDGLNTIAISLTRVRGPAIVGAAIGAAALGPALAGATGGILGAGIGTLGVVGGVATAARDQRVRQEFNRFGDTAMESLGGAAFVQPTVEALRELGKVMQEIKIGEALALVSDDVGRLAEGVGDFARNIMPGLREALERSGPFIDVFAEGLGEIGGALGHFMADVTASPGAIMALDATLGVIASTIEGLGSGIRFLSDAFGGAVIAGAAFTGALEDIPGLGIVYAELNDIAEGWLDNIKAQPDAVKDANGQIRPMLKDQASHWRDMANRIRDVNRELQTYMSRSMEVAATGDEFEAAIDDLTESLRENGNTIDANTERGRENRDAFRDAIRAAQDHRTAQIEAGLSVADANLKYQEQINKIEGIAEQAGITRDQLLELAGRYDISINVTARASELASRIVAAAGLRAGQLRAQLSGLQEFATGGIVEGPIGSPQLVVAHAGERVLTPQQQRALETGPTQVMLSFRPSGDRLIDAIMEGLRVEIDRRGGDGRALGIRAIA